MSLSITASLVKKSTNAKGLTGTLGATITQGVVIAKNSGGAIVLADSTGDELQSRALGIMLNAGSTGQPGDYCAEDTAFEPGFSAIEGKFYILGTAGGILESTDIAEGMRAVLIGIGIAGGKIALKIASGGVLQDPNHTVIFDANGGAGSMAAQTSSVPVDLHPNEFTNEGFTFGGWKTEPGAGTSYGDQAEYDFSADITLYAQWA